MKRNLKRKHLSHEHTKGSVDHGKAQREKEGRPGYCSQTERRGLSGKAGFLILHLLNRTLLWPTPPANTYGL
jgi:hypothetical protein